MLIQKVCAKRHRAMNRATIARQAEYQPSVASDRLGKCAHVFLPEGHIFRRAAGSDLGKKIRRPGGKPTAKAKHP